MRRSVLLAIGLTAWVGTVAAEVKPFATDMYVKSPGFGYHIFRGTRSVSYCYSEAGWSVGEMNNGMLCFTIADGTNKSSVLWPSIDTSWREGEWNHMAASFADGELLLWINGERAPSTGTHYYEDRGMHRTNVCCVTSIASPRAVVTNGHDVMTGGHFTGQVADYRFFNRALGDAEVAARAAKVSELRANDPDAPKMVPDEIGIDVAPPRAPAEVPLTLQPAPQTAELSESNVSLAGPFAIEVPGGSGFAKTAGEVLQAALAHGCGVTATVVTDGADVRDGKGTVVARAGTRFVFACDAKLGREDYRIEGRPVDAGYRLTVFGSERGFVYAADTLRQLLRIRSISNGRRLSLPANVRIEDRPLMPYRSAIFGWRYVTRSAALRFATARMNSLSLGVPDPDVTVERLRACCKTAESCGVDVVSWIDYQATTPWTFADPASMAEYRACIDLLGKGGARGFRFMFDDLCGKAASVWDGNPEMKRRFRSRGAFHNALFRQGLDWAAAYTNLVSTFVAACPLYYSRGWGKNGRGYYADFSNGFHRQGVLLTHCVFEANDVAHLMEDGAETYAFIMNGLWPTRRFFTWYIGPESFRWSWYTWHVDLNGRGPVVNPEAMAGVRTLHERSPLFWCAANSDLARVQAGIISWNPPAYDPDLCDRATAQAFFGTGAYEQLRVIETALMPIIGYLGAFRTKYSLEWDLHTIRRRVGPSKKEYAGYRRNYAVAEAAYAALVKAFENQRTPFDRPDLGDRREEPLKELRKTLDVVRKRLPLEM